MREGWMVMIDRVNAGWDPEVKLRARCSGYEPDWLLAALGLRA
jgi:uncharacterized protein (DUF2235 family)